MQMSKLSLKVHEGFFSSRSSELICCVTMIRNMHVCLNRFMITDRTQTTNKIGKKNWRFKVTFWGPFQRLSYLHIGKKRSHWITWIVRFCLNDLRLDTNVAVLIQLHLLWWKGKHDHKSGKRSKVTTMTLQYHQKAQKKLRWNQTAWILMSLDPRFHQSLIRQMCGTGPSKRSSNCSVDPM